MKRKTRVARPSAADPAADAPPSPADDRDPAFAESGFFYRDGRPIPPTHPDHGPMALLPRQQDGSFAAYYYCSREELEDAEIDRPPPRRHRHDGFTAERQRIFIETLAATASVADAARAADIARTTAYRLYNSADAPGFRAAWDGALRMAMNVLATTAFDRAVNGVEEIVYHKGDRVGVRWKYNDRLLMFLLRVRDPLNFAPLDDLQGWLRHRDAETPRPLEPALDRLAAAEQAWGDRLDPPPNAALRHLAADDPAPALPAVEGDAPDSRFEDDGDSGPDEAPPHV